MSLLFRIRDFFHPPKEKIVEVGLQPGWRVVDYGCGSGSYSLAAAAIVGVSGKIYAIDIHPLALKMITQKASKAGLTNIETILTDCQTGLESNSIDVVLMYDVFHSLPDPAPILAELHRVLKPRGRFVMDDHHMSEAQILEAVRCGGGFEFFEKGRISYHFTKN